MKRLLSIQDVSCIGKCSLTVALPIISAMGIECAVIPTAVLSTHTAFSGFTFRDLTGEIAPITEHWKKENMTFDAIYTGYLGSFEQIRLVSGIFKDFRPKNGPIVVDPAMADNGVLYKGFTEEFAREMGKLCDAADVILPNLTEASYILGIPYPGEDYSEDTIRDILKRLAARGIPHPALTGVALEKNGIGAMAYDAEKDTFFHYENERLPKSFHGTGDVFASAAAGALVRGKSLDEALTLAVDYTLETMRETLRDPDSVWYGVNFEAAIPFLVQRL